jgi:hypothetical protein
MVKNAVKDKQILRNLCPTQNNNYHDVRKKINDKNSVKNKQTQLKEIFGNFY